MQERVLARTDHWTPKWGTQIQSSSLHTIS